MKKQRSSGVHVVERRKIVDTELRGGKSRRQIARQLGCDEGTVRRDMKVLALPASELARAQRGMAVEPLLRRDRRRKERLQHIARAQEEQRSAAYSSSLAETVFEWLKSAPLFPVDALRVIGMADQRCWRAGMTFNQAAAPDADPADVIDNMQPGALPDDMAGRIEFYALWLERWLTRLEPNRDTRDRALRLVKQQLERATKW